MGCGGDNARSLFRRQPSAPLHRCDRVKFRAGSIRWISRISTESQTKVGPTPDSWRQFGLKATERGRQLRLPACTTLLDRAFVTAGRANRDQSRTALTYGRRPVRLHSALDLAVDCSVSPSRLPGTGDHAS